MAADRKMHRAVASAMETVKKLDMVARGDSILISVSGGPDSVFLTHLLLMLKDQFRLDLYGFSLDHCTRDGRSGKDAGFVARMYKDLGIRLFTRKVDAGKWCRERKLSFQEGARKLRAGLLRELARENDIDRIALGHNLDDNIETFLMRMIRGSGARGLSGIRPVSGKIIRPLINTSRQDIEDYLKANDIVYCIDSSNLEDKYTRNRIRNKLIPFIGDNFQGDVNTSIKRVIDILGQEDEYLSGIASGVLKKDAFIQKSPGRAKVIYIRLPLATAGKYHRALKRRAAQTALELLWGSLEDISYSNIEDILDLMGPGRGENRRLDLPGPIVVLRIADIIHMVHTGFIQDLDPGIRRHIRQIKDMGSTEAASAGQTILIGGRTVLEDFGFCINSKILDEPGDYRKLGDSKAVMDYDKVKGPVIVRRWSKGDRFQPLGMKGEKKLQDFFTDCRVPVNLRKEIPVFCDREKIIWVGNMRMDHRVRITSSARGFLQLELFEK
jgi:tRNA(Ile)-lysidine synthase